MRLAYSRIVSTTLYRISSSLASSYTSRLGCENRRKSPTFVAEGDGENCSSEEEKSEAATGAAPVAHRPAGRTDG